MELKLGGKEGRFVRFAMRKEEDVGFIYLQRNVTATILV